MTLKELVKSCRPDVDCYVALIKKSKSDPRYYDWRPLKPYGDTRTTADHILNWWYNDLLDLEVKSIDVQGGLHGQLGIDVVRWID